MALPVAFPTIAAWLGGLLPVIFHSLRLVLAVSLVAFLLRVLAAFGIGYALFTGLETLFANLETQVIARMGALGDVASILGMMGADVGISMLFSAIGVVLTFRAFGGVVRKFIAI